MHAALTPEDRAFQAELREFFASVPDELRAPVRAGGHVPLSINRKAQQLLDDAGLAVPAWPQEWGGRDWSPLQQFIWESELQRAYVPPPLSRNVRMIGPTIAEFGSPELKRRFLRATARLDIAWCQGFSEPGAGSDLASLQTTAVRDADSWIVNGQKTWTTMAQHSDWMFALLRTDPTEARPQAGISMLLLAMDSPGITVRPIRLIDGGEEVCEVFLENVRVPHQQMVGEVNCGWRYATFLLGNERMGVAPIGTLKRRLAEAKAYAAMVDTGSGRLVDEPDIRDRIVRLETDLMALELTLLRVLTAGHSQQRPVASILKLRSSELQQAIEALVVDIAGGMAGASSSDSGGPVPRWAVDALPKYLNYRKATIYGGTSEIQREIIARSLLDR